MGSAAVVDIARPPVGPVRLADGCRLAVVVPFGGAAPWRRRALAEAVRAVAAAGVPVVVSCRGDVPGGLDGVVVRTGPDDGGPFPKAALANRGIEHFLHCRGWEWLLVLDGDIVFDVGGFLEFLASVGGGVDVASPWQGFGRLDRAQTAGYYDGAAAFRVAGGAMMYAAGAGGLALRRGLLEGGFRWDEGMVGWGWEDSDAARRAVAASGDGQSPGRRVAAPGLALHLWHEDDRVPVAANKTLHDLALLREGAVRAGTGPVVSLGGLSGSQGLGFVVVYYNACGYRAMLDNMLAFLERWAWLGDRLVVVELAYGAQPHALGGLARNLVQLRTGSVLWHKENLINLGSRVLLDAGFDRVGWLDGDTVLPGDGERWYARVAAALERHRVVQVFERVLHRYSDRDIESLGSVANYFGPNPPPLHKVWKTGLGWAVRADIWSRCGGWYANGVVGSGDKLAFMASVGVDPAKAVEDTPQLRSSSAYMRHYLAWAEKWHGLVAGDTTWLPGVAAVAEPHGRHVDRNYYQRELMLAETGYDPVAHVEPDANGVLGWTEEAPAALRIGVMDYFQQRKEDDDG